MLLAVVALLAPSSSVAQVESDPVSAARIRLGPLGITPTLTLSTGVDTNVFNEADDAKQDLTTAISPRVQAWFRMRRLLVEAQNATDAIGYREYSGQGGLSTRNEVRASVPLNRLRLTVINSFASIQQRASLEIDTRVRRRDNNLTGVVDLRATPRTVLRASAARSTTGFADEASYLGVSLAETLNRTAQTAELSIRYEATSVTTVVGSIERMQERFERSPERDSGSLRVAPGVEFQRGGLFTGRAFAGYRRFSIDSGLAADFTGPVAAVELSSTLRGDTRVGVQVSRDVAYSFEVTTPYYVLTATGVTLGRRLADRWDVTAQAARQRLGYRRRTTASVPADGSAGDRVDTVFSLGGGVNYRLSPSLRFGLNVDRSRRRSGLVQRTYDGTRILGQFTYGPS